MIIAAFWILRIGLAATLIYAGIDMMIQPQVWLGFFPAFALAASPLKETPTVIMHGIAHIVLAVGLLYPKTVRWAAVFTALLLMGVLIFSGDWFVTFRDVGLLAIAVALIVWPKSVAEPSTHNTLQVGAICLRPTFNSLEVLCAQRTSDQVYYPSQWDCGVGRARMDETLEQAAERKIRESFGVESRALAPVASFSFFPTGRKVTQGVKYVCLFQKYLNGKGVALDKKEFSQWQWLPIEQLDAVAWIQGRERSAADDVRSAISYYKAMGEFDRRNAPAARSLA
ncbi:NUDIX hydrolase [Candidatus Uhrbacteria bacterium]|nr:NUDIX hydrolase [Candidatus Uhrbacteria bacterium]